MQRGPRRFGCRAARLPRRPQITLAPIEFGKQTAIAVGPVRDIRMLEQVSLLMIEPRDARRLMKLYDSRVTAPQLFTPHLARQRAEVRNVAPLVGASTATRGWPVADGHQSAGGVGRRALGGSRRPMPGVRLFSAMPP
jgi:hypothetical protein